MENLLFLLKREEQLVQLVWFDLQSKVSQLILVSNTANKDWNPFFNKYQLLKQNIGTMPKSYSDNHCGAMHAFVEDMLLGKNACVTLSKCSW